MRKTKINVELLIYGLGLKDAELKEEAKEHQVKVLGAIAFLKG